MEERWELALLRIAEIAGGQEEENKYLPYFKHMAKFLRETAELPGKLDSLTGAELAGLNKRLYEELLEENYDSCYGNPDYCCGIFGKEEGQALCFLYAQLRNMLPLSFEAAVYGERKKDMLILLELFLEVHSCVQTYMNEEGDKSDLTLGEQLKNILYYYVSDYADCLLEDRVEEMLCPERDFALRLIMDSELSDTSYLYRFGEYISNNEIRTAEFLNSLGEAEIKAMADTYTEGYRIGFEVTGKDLSKKKTVNIRYNLGFERVVRAAVENFRAMGLESIIYRGALHAVSASIAGRSGYVGGSVNRQYDYDHREDMALFLDKAFKERKLEMLRHAYEKYKQKAGVHAGPAVMETFGEKPFMPKEKESRLRLSDKQQKLLSQLGVQTAALVNEYIKGEERSFTIIAYPIPEIGAEYENIFRETIRLNTLDYKTYERLQQKIILALDPGEYVRIKGRGENTTDMRVSLRKLSDIKSQTQFENCVADVNIPVGEVFTSPVLEGTEGRLFVSRVYLNGLRYEKLSLDFKEGRVVDYECSNFEKRDEGRAFIKKNILAGFDSLPIGEFAIGTNTVAYAMAGKYDIFDRLPILIAEKTGPHFAVGDTCYSHAEDIRVFNPDGREIVSKENSLSALRRTEPEKAYFGCHTDITLPYEELGSVTVYYSDGSSCDIIRDGRFVLEGTEDLNLPLESAID